MKCMSLAPEKYDTIEFEFAHSPRIIDALEGEETDGENDELWRRDEPADYAPMTARFQTVQGERILMFLSDWTIGDALDQLADFIDAATATYEGNR